MGILKITITPACETVHLPGSFRGGFHFDDQCVNSALSLFFYWNSATQAQNSKIFENNLVEHEAGFDALL
jgi:hypothetical protein